MLSDNVSLSNHDGVSVCFFFLGQGGYDIYFAMKTY